MRGCCLRERLSSMGSMHPISGCGRCLEDVSDWSRRSQGRNGVIWVEVRASAATPMTGKLTLAPHKRHVRHSTARQQQSSSNPTPHSPPPLHYHTDIFHRSAVSLLVSSYIPSALVRDALKECPTHLDIARPSSLAARLLPFLVPHLRRQRANCSHPGLHLCDHAV